MLKFKKSTLEVKMEDENKKTILHVDDQQMMLNFIKDIFGKDYVVMSFLTLTAAQRFFYDNKDKIDLVICDGTIGKPFDGRQWAEELHKFRQKVILASGDAVYDGKPETLVAIEKPFSYEVLVSTVEQMLQ